MKKLEVIKGPKELYQFALREIASNKKRLHPKGAIDHYAYFEYGPHLKFVMHGDLEIEALKRFVELYEKHKDQIQNQFSVSQDIFKVISTKTTKALRLAEDNDAHGFYMYKVA